MSVTASSAAASVNFPNGKRFAFTILDDTDDATLRNIRPLYDLLTELGIRTTKTVWPLRCPEGSELFFAAETLDDPEYLSYMLELQARGFEITWHAATMEPSLRERTVRGLERFRAVFGDYPRFHVNHGQNRENVYWGHSRYQSPGVQLLSRAFKPRRTGEQGFEGEREDSPYFWGDHCREHCRFVRNFTFNRINTLKSDPFTPYSLSSTPCVNYWFSTSDAPDATAFKRLVTRDGLEKLIEENGACILSTHLGKGFVCDGVVDREVETVLRFLAAQDGWFVPVSPMLEFLAGLKGRGQRLTSGSLVRLELAHIYDRLRH